MPRLLASTFLIAALALPFNVAAQDVPTRIPGVIHVSASSSVDTVPDEATVSAGVQTDGKTAQEAMMRNSELMRSVFRALAQAGVPERDVSTSYLNLNPRYDYENRQNGQPKLVGYRASNQVSITTRNLDNVGPLIDALITAGVNNINNIQFSVSNADSAEDIARDQAIAKARRKAQSMAAAAGVELGRLVSLSEGSTPAPMPYFESSALMARSAAADSAPPLAPGQREIRATVTLSYAIAD